MEIGRRVKAHVSHWGLVIPIRDEWIFLEGSSRSTAVTGLFE